MKADMVKRLLKLEDRIKAGKESDIEREMMLYAEFFQRRPTLSDGAIAEYEKLQSETDDDDPAMKNYREALKKATEEEAKQKAEIERLRLEHEAEAKRKRQIEIAEREKLEHEHKEYTEMLKRGPDDKKLIRAPFGKELVKDDKGNLFWRTVLHLEDCELPVKLDADYEAALNSCDVL